MKANPDPNWGKAKPDHNVTIARRSLKVAYLGLVISVFGLAAAWLAVPNDRIELLLKFFGWTNPNLSDCKIVFMGKCEWKND